MGYPWRMSIRCIKLESLSRLQSKEFTHTSSSRRSKTFNCCLLWAFCTCNGDENDQSSFVGNFQSPKYLCSISHLSVSGCKVLSKAFNSCLSMKAFSIFDGVLKNLCFVDGVSERFRFQMLCVHFHKNLFHLQFAFQIECTDDRTVGGSEMFNKPWTINENTDKWQLIAAIKYKI